MKIIALLLSLFILQTANAQSVTVLHNAQIYTVNPDQPTAEAMAFSAEGKILAVGTKDSLFSVFPERNEIDAGGKTVIPGLIDAHAHLIGMGQGKMRADLMGTTSRADILENLIKFAATLPTDTTWLLGRGWDQNDWPVQAFPSRDDLDIAFPNRPVWLRRIDGHAGWANSAAVNRVGEMLLRMKDPEGGKILRDAAGRPTGVFVDAAMGFIGNLVPEPTDIEQEAALKLALIETAKYGLTGVHDAGVTLKDVNLIKKAIDQDWFTIRHYGMIAGIGETLDYFCDAGALIDYGDKLTVRSVKLYSDGALGSRGAALLSDYADDAGNNGLLFYQPEVFQGMVTKAMECGFQVNTHAIGDRGNRTVLDAYEVAITETGQQAGRHRIEHAQVVSLDDIPRFKALNLIASVQPTHATSDMYWAEERVGSERIKGAYAWQKFVHQGTPLALGSDFPVERVDPLLGFYAAVTRQDDKNWPAGGWYPEENLTREQALHGFTLGAAYAAFQEDQLGSLEVGKWADFVILSEDIMTIPTGEILDVIVESTWLAGQPIYIDAE